MQWRVMVLVVDSSAEVVDSAIRGRKDRRSGAEQREEKRANGMGGGHGQVPAGGKRKVPEDNSNDGDGDGDGTTHNRQIGNEWTGTDGGEAAQTRTRILSTGTRIRVMVR